MEALAEMPSSSPLSVLPAKSLYPEITYEYPRPVMGLGNSKMVQRKLKSVAASTNDSFTLTHTDSGERTLLFRLPQGGQLVDDFRDGLLRCRVTAGGGQTVTATTGYVSGIIRVVRLRSATDQLFELVNYNHCYNAMQTFLSTDAYTQYRSLDAGLAAALPSGSSAYFACPLMLNPLVCSSQCWPTFAGQGDLILEVVVTGFVDEVGVLSGTAATLSYSNFELIYSSISLGSDLYTQLMAEYQAKGTLYYKSLDFVSNQAPLSVGAVSAKFQLNNKRVKSAVFWARLIAVNAAGTENYVNKTLAMAGSFQIYRNGRPLFSRALLVSTTEPDLYRVAQSCFKEIDDIYRGSRLLLSQFTDTGVTAANRGQGAVYCVDFENINGNTDLSYNAIDIDDGLQLTWSTAVAAASTLYGLYICESGIMFEANGGRITREF